MALMRGQSSVLLLLFVAFIAIVGKNVIDAADCQTRTSRITPQQDRADDDQKEYIMINIPGFEQNATVVECLPDQSCTKGKCQQDFKLHQFMTVPREKQQFELSDLKFRFFKIPYGCKCAA